MGGSTRRSPSLHFLRSLPAQGPGGPQAARLSLAWGRGFRADLASGSVSGVSRTWGFPPSRAQAAGDPRNLSLSLCPLPSASPSPLAPPARGWRLPRPPSVRGMLPNWPLGARPPLGTASSALETSRPRLSDPSQKKQRLLHAPRLPLRPLRPRVSDPSLGGENPRHCGCGESPAPPRASRRFLERLGRV